MKNTIKYADYDVRTQSAVQAIENDLVEEIGKLPMSYEIQLLLLADALDIYYAAKDAIKTRGIIVLGRQGEATKNPATSILNASWLTISKLLSGFVLTRAQKAKFNKELQEDESAPIDEFLK